MFQKTRCNVRRRNVEKTNVPQRNKFPWKVAHNKARTNHILNSAVITWDNLKRAYIQEHLCTTFRHNLSKSRMLCFIYKQWQVFLFSYKTQRDQWADARYGDARVSKWREISSQDVTRTERSSQYSATTQYGRSCAGKSTSMACQQAKTRRRIYSTRNSYRRSRTARRGTHSHAP